MKKQNIILVLLVLALIWLAVLSWLLLSQNETLNLHEFWIKESLQNIE